MNFFINCTSLDEAKQLFKKLALENHPDRGGDTATMQKINADYKFIVAKLINGSNFTTEQTENEVKFSEQYQTVINAIIALEGLNIELVGTWVWVTGNTYQHKEILKANGLFFAPKKQAWYFRSEDNKCKFSQKLDLDQIKSKYGSITLSGKPNTKKQIK